MKDGDHPDSIVITYGRCNAAAELTEDLIRLYPPARWVEISVKMLDRDALADDERWAALQRRRQRALGRRLEGIPSYSTRVTVGHMLAIAAQAWLLATAPDAPHGGDAGERSGWTINEARPIAWEAAQGRCQAAGLHHPLCPGAITDRNVTTFVVHHVFPREQAKKQKIPDGVVHRPSNLIVVWNGHTGLGAGGCHGRIHSQRTSARTLGLLAAKGATMAWSTRAVKDNDVG